MRFVPFRSEKQFVPQNSFRSVPQNTPDIPKSYPWTAQKSRVRILETLLVSPTMPTADLGSPRSSTWTVSRHLSIKKSTKCGGRLWRPPRFVEAARSVASFMDRCVLTIQVEDFGLPKSAMGTLGRTSQISRILTLEFLAVQVQDFGMSRVLSGTQRNEFRGTHNFSEWNNFVERIISWDGA